MRLAIVLLALVGIGVVHAEDIKPDHDEELKLLAEWMTGHFTSAEQAAKDKEFFEVHLNMVPIWTERKGEYWLYVEQAMASALDKPYRQRIYRLSWPDGAKGPESAVYFLPDDPLKFAGAHKKPELLAKLKPEDLKLKDGCAIHLLKKDKDTYEGATEGKKCASDLRGASYATSEVKVTKDTLTSWDRGYDKDDKQVWGATKGPYMFKKK